MKFSPLHFAAFLLLVGLCSGINDIWTSISSTTCKLVGRDNEITRLNNANHDIRLVTFDLTADTAYYDSTTQCEIVIMGDYDDAAAVWKGRDIKIEINKLVGDSLSCTSRGTTGISDTRSNM